MTQHLNGASSSQSQATPRPSRSPQATNPSPGSSPRAPSPRGGSSGTIDVEAVLRASGGNVKRALEVMVLERNNLVRTTFNRCELIWQQAQNSQLWKLIEKQRAQSAHLNADNERLRSDRERANTKLAAAGLEPVNGKRIPNSSSAVGLGLRPEVPQIRRHNSDREEKSPKPTLQVPLINNSAPASHTDETPPATFLPSPIPEPKLRRGSRMAFPPEVTSFMTLAESPRDATHGTTPNVPASWSNNTLSPASQYSPSPSQNGREEVSGRTAPASSRALAVTTEEEEEEEEDTGRHHRSRNGSLAFPPLRKSSLSPEEQKTAIVPPAPPLEEIPRPSYETSSPRASQDMDTPRATRDPQPSQEKFDLPFRSLPSLAPALLPRTRLAIPTSTVHTNSLGRHVLSFIISISVRPPTAQSSSWNVAKLFSAFIDLDTKIKSRSGKGRKEWKSMVAPLPDGRAWKDFAPSKIDQRRKAIEAYLQSLLVAPISDKTDLCEFLTTDPVQNKMESARKEGYLTKKGKNFGGWKRRFFVLEGPMVKYFETVS